MRPFLRFMSIVGALLSIALPARGADRGSCAGAYAQLGPRPAFVENHRLDILSATAEAERVRFSQPASAKILDTVEPMLREGGITYSRRWLPKEGEEAIRIPATPDNLGKLGWNIDTKVVKDFYYCPRCLFKEQAGAYAQGQDLYVSHGTAATLRFSPTLVHEYTHAEIDAAKRLRRPVDLAVEFASSDDGPMKGATSAPYKSFLTTEELATFGRQLRAELARLRDSPDFHEKLAENLAALDGDMKNAQGVFEDLGRLTGQFVRMIGDGEDLKFRHVTETPYGRSVRHFAVVRIGNTDMRVAMSRREIRLYREGRREDLRAWLVEKVQKVAEIAERRKEEITHARQALAQDQQAGRIENLPDALAALAEGGI